MSRAKKALAALAALAAAAAAAHPAAVPAPANCSRHIRLGVFEEAIPYAVTYMTGWMDNAATACFSFHHMPTGNRAIELIANGFLHWRCTARIAKYWSHQVWARTRLSTSEHVSLASRFALF